MKKSSVEHRTERGIHAYEDVWSPLIGEQFSDCMLGEENENDKNNVMVYRNDLINKYIVAYTPLYFSKTVCKFLQFPNTIVSCSVLENVQAKGPGYGMGIPVTCTL